MGFWDVALVCLVGQTAIVVCFIAFGKWSGALHLIELKMSGAAILFTAGVVGYASVWGGLGFWTALGYGVACLLAISGIIAALLLAIFAVNDRLRG